MALLAEIQATCSALGYLEGEQYVKEADCLESVKDLIRYLKREDDTCDIRRLLGEAQIVQNDLIPILRSPNEDSLLLDTVVRLLVNLTQPALICFQGYIPTEKTQHNFYLEVLGHLGAYKQAFADQSLLQALCQKLGDLLQLDWENRQEEDRLLIERILMLIRNVLHIAPIEDERRTDDDASIHDQVLWAIHTSGMEDLLLFIASSNDERQFAIHILEIITLMFREQSADQLARAGAGRTMTEKEKDEQELLQSRQREKIQKRMTAAKYSTRHSRFGGTYVLQDVKSITDNAMIYHRSQGDVKNISFDQGKRPKKLGKNRKPIREDNQSRRSTLSIRLAMKHFCIQFIENCFNPLMNCVKDRLQHSQTEENDETYYIWAMRFFMEFQRNYKFRVDVISETLNTQAFHYIHVQIMTYNDMMTTNKNEAKIWGKRMHLALKAYKELLMTLGAMDKGSETIRESAKVLKGNIFYVPEYKDLLLMLLCKFNQSKNSRSYLKDLVETTHVFIKLLEQYCTGKNHVMVQGKKKKKRKPKKKRSETEETNNNDNQENEDLDEKWDEISSELSAMIQGREEVPEVVSPFDAASEVEIDQQRDDAMFRIHDALRTERAGEALALLRAARQVWPDQQVFGQAEMSPEAEFMAVREIFFTNLNRGGDAGQPAEGEEEEEEEEDEEDAAEWTSSETQFEFKEYIMKFIKPEIMKPYVLLLSEYRRNSAQTNHYLVKMLHRISVDCKTPGILFQMSLFRVFQKLLTDPVAKVSHKELLKFAQFIIVKFFDAKNRDIFHETLFWKNVRESLELIDGFGTYTNQKAKASSWTEEEEMELQRLFEEHKDKDDPEMDLAELIMKDIINENRSRRQIIAKLAHMNLISGAKDIKKKKKPDRSKQWLEEDESHLRGLFEENRENPNVLQIIVSGLNVKRSKNSVVDKMLSMGLIAERREVMKGGRRKKKGGEEELERAPKSKEFISSGDDDSETERGLRDSSSDGDGSEDDLIQKSRKKKGGRKDDSSDDDDAFDKFLNKSKKPEAKLPEGSLDNHVKKVLEAGLEDELEWIVTTWKDEAADRDEEKADEATPVVPLNAAHSSALENRSFKAMLKSIGARPPVDEQERYWRIPEYFTPDMLRERIKKLEKAQENSKEPKPIPEETSDKENQTPKPKPKARLNKRRMSESSSEDEDPLRLVLDDTQESSPVKSPPSKRSRLDSDAEMSIGSKGNESQTSKRGKSKASQRKSRSSQKEASSSQKEAASSQNSDSQPSSRIGSGRTSRSRSRSSSHSKSRSGSSRSRSRSRSSRRRSRSRSSRSRSRSRSSRSRSRSRSSRSRSRSMSSRSRSRSRSSRRRSRSRSSRSRSRSRSSRSRSPASRNSSRPSSRNSTKPKSSQNSQNSAKSSQNSPSKASQTSSGRSSRLSDIKSPARKDTVDSSDSDSDVEDRIPLRKVVKKAMIDSDSD